jgi:ABC-type multidrug transport system permease subunit
MDNKDFVLENIKKNMEMMFRVKTSILFVFLANITLSTIDSLVLAIFFRIFFANYLRGLKKNT